MFGPLLEVEMLKKRTASESDRFWKLRCRKSARRCGAKRFPSQNVKNSTCSDHFWTSRCRFAWQAQGVGVGHLKKIRKDALSVAGAKQETCSSEMLGGPSADFLRGVAFWSIRSSVFGRWF